MPSAEHLGFIDAENKKARDREIQGRAFSTLNPVVRQAHHPELAEGQRPTPPNPPGCQMANFRSE